jgi:hypothetical protein
MSADIIAQVIGTIIILSWIIGTVVACVYNARMERADEIAAWIESYNVVDTGSPSA